MLNSLLLELKFHKSKGARVNYMHAYTSTKLCGALLASQTDQILSQRLYDAKKIMIHSSTLDYVIVVFFCTYVPGPNNEPPSDGVEIVLSSISIPFLSLAGFLLLVALAIGAILLGINIFMRENK